MALSARSPAPRGYLDTSPGSSMPRIMGILNCTPDSFSDGGEYLDPGRAVERAFRMFREGASIIDIGGESSRPGSGTTGEEEELRRILPVIRRLRREMPELLFSVDTRKTGVAAAALENGACMINDISGGSPELFSLVVRHQASVVLMHMRGEPQKMQENTSYEDIVGEVQHYLLARAEAAMEAGIPRKKVFLDPGIGFGKNDEGNLALLRGLPGLALAGFPLVLGTSRKSFIGRLSGAPVEDRLPGSLASLIPALAVPDVIVRVHDVAETRQFFAIAARIGGVS